MYRGWLNFGGNEIANNERVRTLTRTAPVPVGWFVDPREPTVQLALSPEQTYDYLNIESAPWYDPTLPASQNFFGVYVMGISGLPDGSRQSGIVESIYDGGTPAIPRKAVKQVTVNALLTARGREALEYGLNWLDAVLDVDACGQHGDLCGLTDLEFLADVPPEQGSLSDADYQALILSQKRYLHSVWAVNSPKIASELESRDVFGYNVQFTIAAGRPFIYSSTTDLDLPPTIPIVYQDIPYNLAQYPSFEVVDGTTPTVATNYAPNPSLEVDASSWAAGLLTTVSGSAVTPYLTSGRSNDIAADRLFSYRARVLGDGATAAAGETKIIANTTADLTTPLATAGTRVSFTAWMSMFVIAGAGGSILKSMQLDLIWLNASNAQVGATVNLGTTTTTADFNGRVFSAKSLVPPAGATKAKVQATYDFNWTSSATPANNSDVRCYIDAVAITVP
jgi:hypothetical protein